ncbi:MAG: acetate--CoA ligase family protein, partial [Gammaproteobacteria bacterium]|nr:acetate--CoA ligase family protein [Gammaproteobacteria bacterium]
SLGYPVVLKAVASDLAHKTEQRAVSLNLQDEDALSKAVESMRDRFDQFLVERMVGPAVAEFIVGIHRDPIFGVSLLIGSGGTLVELFGDTVSLLLPVQRHEIESAMSGLKANRLLDGYRGMPTGDREAVMDAIERIGHYAGAHSDDLIEVDINPLLATPDGAIAVDAKLRVTKALERG